MPLLRRSARLPELAAASRRVRDVLPGARPGWVPPAVGDGGEPAAPAAEVVAAPVVPLAAWLRPVASQHDGPPARGGWRAGEGDARADPERQAEGTGAAAGTGVAAGGAAGGGSSSGQSLGEHPGSTAREPRVASRRTPRRARGRHAARSAPGSPSPVAAGQQPEPDLLGGWVLPVRPEAGVAGGLPPDAPPGVPEERPAVPGLERPVVPGLLERLAGGRLDPGRPAVVGLALVAVLACLVAGLLVVRSAPEEVLVPTVERAGRPVEGAIPPAPETPAPSGEVVVAVAGEVRKPGIVRLPSGSRVDDAVRAAGGLRPGATAGLLNLARKVVDGEQVLVGVEPPGAGAAAGSAAADPARGAAAGARASGLVDLNTATAADLDALPGIGPVLAQRILDHRAQDGPFRSVDQLREVSGIGEAKYASLRDAVTV